MPESTDFWNGFHEALELVDQQVDIFLATGYNEARTKDAFLDLKTHLKKLREMSGTVDDILRSVSRPMPRETSI